MATPIIMPRQGQSVESCIIAKWHKKKGDKVNVGDLLFTYETDKATFDEESEMEGILLDIFFEEGDDIPVLTNVCVIGEEGENVDHFNPNVNDGEKTQEEKTKGAVSKVVEQYNKNDVKAQNEEMPQVPTTDANNQEGIIKISPRARNLAERSSVDYREAAATGPEGRIIERDINNLIENGNIVTYAAGDEYYSSDNVQIKGTGIGGRITTADLQDKHNILNGDMLDEVSQTAGNDYKEVKLTNMRKVIAKAMHNSLASTAQLTLNSSFDAREILNFRKNLKENKDTMGLENITLNDIILFAVSRTLLNHKELNAHLVDDTMFLFNNVHLGVAVDTERGLMVPTLFNSNLKSLNDISKQSKSIIEQAQSGTINPDYLQGGTFTITNLGTLGIESFTPVLNPPQTGILGVNTIVQAVKQVNDEYVYYPSMGLSLTFDHRAIDGAPAAKFLKELKSNLENFTILLTK